jgi:ABC-type dipeptide/oligopeptide/nickel transport system permease component
MLAYTLKRLGGILMTLVLLSLFTFTLSRVVPGGPWAQGAEIPLSQEQVLAFKEKYGLNEPVWKQYLIWLGNAATLDFGRPFTEPERTVTELIRDTLPFSALLGGIAATLAITMGVTLGVIAAAYQESWIDSIVTSYAVVIATVPSFVMAFLMKYFLAAKLRWFPSGGWGDPSDWRKVALHLILPVIAFGLPATGGVARWTRQCIAEAMASDYVRTAYAKGLRSTGVLTRHVLRNALIPMITSFLPLYPGMMTGSLFIEAVFGLPGLGKYFVVSSTNRDYPLVLGITMFWALLIALTYFLTDVLYGVIDPRVRISERQR